jgi:hypothetical protein
MTTYTEQRQAENKKIQDFILANHTKMDSYQMAEKLGVEPNRVGGNLAYLKRANKLTNAIANVKESLNVLKNVASIVTKSTNTYTNHNGENKEKARIKMANYIINSGVVGVIATLANTLWLIEQKIANQLPEMEFISAEIDEPTYITMKQNLKKLALKAKTYFGKIGDLIFGKVEDSYAHLILDYCGMLPTFSKEIEYVINNNVIKVGGIMAITFGKPIRGTDVQSTKIMGLAPINNGDDRCQSDRGIEAYFAKITGWNYEVKEIFYYSDKKEGSNGNGYPMTLVIIQRIK